MGSANLPRKRQRRGGHKPAEVITVTLGGKTFRTGRRTAAHLQWTIDEVDRKYPKATLQVIQGSYNSTVAASAGTHDYDGVLDVRIAGVDWHEAQGFLRRHGWAAWYRTPAQGFTEHIHMVSLGCPGPVGIYVPRQVEDYYDHLDGLAGHDPDPTWHPGNIDTTVFSYPEWLKQKKRRR